MVEMSRRAEFDEESVVWKCDYLREGELVKEGIVGRREEIELA